MIPVARGSTFFRETIAMGYAMRRSIRVLGLFPLILAAASLGAAELTDNEVASYKKELKDITQVREATRMGDLIQRLARLDDPRTASIIIEGAVVLPSAKNYDLALKALARSSNEQTIEELIRLSTADKDFRHRVLILGAFGERKDERTRKAVYAALDEKVSPVQLAAIRACRDRKEKEAVPVLIGLVEKNQSQRNMAWIDAREALLALTGQDYEKVEDWKKFWDAKKDTLDPAHLDQTNGATRIVVKKVKDSVEFFGKEIHSQNVVFVLDCSGSMVLYDEDPDFRGKNQEYERQRLTRAKEQCFNVIQKLKGRVHFNIIAYNDKLFSWQKSLVPASPENTESARKFTKRMKADGFTHTDEALERAFQDPSIDTIVLLSDGAPAKKGGGNGMGLQKRILQRVKDLNASRKLRINTFGFEGVGKIPKSLGGGSAGLGGGGVGGVGGGDSVMVEFLKQLAKENGGEYQPIK
jgi:von Willebrand factor type A domain